MQTLLIVSFLILIYTYIGYGLILWVMARNKRKGAEQLTTETPEDVPTVAVLIPAYNEEDVIEEKIRNTMALDYPQAKKYIYVITDGSTDNTPEIVRKYTNVVHLHTSKRSGKVGAINRAMNVILADITVSTDANTLLNTHALQEMVKHFQDPRVVAVGGEKKIIQYAAENASGAGEGLYWKYESTLKKLDASVNTMVGAAGELIAYRSCKYERIPEDTILEDFYMTMQFAVKGYKVAYESKAYAMEKPSASISDELKRKIRISAGAFQSIVRFKDLLAIRNLSMLSFQYISHRVLRWTVAPVALLTFFASNMLMINSSTYYKYLALLQIAFYLMAGTGYLLKRLKLKVKILHVPYYFCMMNYALFAGFLRFLKGNQSVTWEKALRRA